MVVVVGWAWDDGGDYDGVGGGGDGGGGGIGGSTS